MEHAVGGTYGKWYMWWVVHVVSGTCGGWYMYDVVEWSVTFMVTLLMEVNTANSLFLFVAVDVAYLSRNVIKSVLFTVTWTPRASRGRLVNLFKITLSKISTN